MSVLHQQIGASGWEIPVPKTDQTDAGNRGASTSDSAINRLVALGITRPRDRSALVIPLRTLQTSPIAPREARRVEESDRVLRVARCCRRRRSVYGSRERALAWLRRLQSAFPVDAPRWTC